MRTLASPIRWFARAPWQTQVMVVLLLILFFAPRYVPTIIELIRALRGG